MPTMTEIVTEASGLIAALGIGAFIGAMAVFGGFKHLARGVKTFFR